MTKPDFKKIALMNPCDAFMAGYKKGREDNKELHNDLKQMFEKAIKDINSG